MKKKEEEQELVFGQRFDNILNDSRPEVTMKDFESKPKPKTTREKFNDKFIRRKSGTLARRGSVAARRAENREAARNRAQDAARKRIANKKK